MKLVKISQLDPILTELIDNEDQFLITDVSELRTDRKSKVVKIGLLKEIFSSGGSGSNVVVTPIQTSGNHIADIKVDGNIFSLYSKDYSSDISSAILGVINDTSSYVESKIEEVNSRITLIADMLTAELVTINNKLNDLTNRVEVLESQFPVLETETTGEYIGLDGYDDTAIVLDNPSITGNE